MISEYLKHREEQIEREKIGDIITGSIVILLIIILFWAVI